jgi:hypothetical protein
VPAVSADDNQVTAVLVGKPQDFVFHGSDLNRPRDIGHSRLLGELSEIRIRPLYERILDLDRHHRHQLVVPAQQYGLYDMNEKKRGPIAFPEFAGPTDYSFRLGRQIYRNQNIAVCRHVFHRQGDDSVSIDKEINAPQGRKECQGNQIYIVSGV